MRHESRTHARNTAHLQMWHSLLTRHGLLTTSHELSHLDIKVPQTVAYTDEWVTLPYTYEQVTNSLIWISKCHQLSHIQMNKSLSHIHMNKSRTLSSGYQSATNCRIYKWMSHSPRYIWTSHELSHVDVKESPTVAYTNEQVTNSRMRHDHLRHDMRHSLISDSGVRQESRTHACDMTHLHVWHGLFTTTWLTYMRLFCGQIGLFYSLTLACDMTHLHMWHGLFTRMAWLTYMRLFCGQIGLSYWLTHSKEAYFPAKGFSRGCSNSNLCNQKTSTLWRGNVRHFCRNIGLVWVSCAHINQWYSLQHETQEIQ